MSSRTPGELPHFVTALSAPVRLLPIGWLLTRALRDLARRRPEVFERLGEHRGRRFIIEPTDMRVAFLVVPDGVYARVTVAGGVRDEGDVFVAGPILVLLGLLDGTFDGDALFFNRAITVRGRTEALLALRNAMEDAELRPSDLLGIRGRPAAMADTHVPRALASIRRMAGLGPGGLRP